MSILSLPSEMLVEIATYLGTTGNLANFKMTSRRIYNAIESTKVNRKRLPHLKIEGICFDYCNKSEIEVLYGQKNENEDRFKKRHWNYSDPLSPKLPILIRHWILEDNCQIMFFGRDNILPIPLLKSLLEINYGNAIQWVFLGDPSKPSKVQESLPFIHEVLKKVGCFPKCFSYFTTLTTALPLIEPPGVLLVVVSIRGNTV